MRLSQEQRTKLREEAARRGVDPDKLIAAAEEDGDGDGDAKPSSGSKAPATAAAPPLYQYHLPFVTVNEVRERWLGLGPITGGEAMAAAFAAKSSAGEKPPSS